MSTAKSKKIYWTILSLVIVFFQSNILHAQIGQSVGPAPIISNPLGRGNDTIAAFIAMLMDTIFPIAAMASIFFMIFAGFRMVLYSSNEEKLAEARQAFLWTVIGIGVLLGAKVFSAVVCGTVNQLLSSPAQLSCPRP
ncbi:MAG: hypothetical protein EXS46_01775 [Candidatus Taylorbacteria bacterium]|nr:hypothetical protein [Candidatus Taylorbacteria bacterium]